MGKRSAEGQHPLASIEHEQGLAHAFHDALGKAGAFLELAFEGFEGRDIGEGDDGPADVVVEGAVGQDAHDVPLAPGSLNVGFHGHQPVKHLAHVLGQVFVAQGVGKIHDGTAHIAG